MSSRSKRIFSIFFFLLFLASSLFLTSGSFIRQTQVAALAYSQEPASSLAYKIVQHPLPNSSSPAWSVAVDSSGRVWFATLGSKTQLGVYNPANGNLAEYSIPIPANSSIAVSVALDSSGNVWYSSASLNASANMLGELENGSITARQWEIPPGELHLAGTNSAIACGAVSTTVDPQGNVWLTCEFSGQIDEFFPNTKTFSEYTLPIFESGANQMVFDSAGNFWFTAADTGMIGRGIVSEMRNGTSNGITESAPINASSSYSGSYFDPLTGVNYTYTSSLNTPNGIALSADGQTLWITEHIGSSFDSYNLVTQSLVKYWTSKIEVTAGLANYQPNPFPYGIAIDSNGIVWIAEHYGNKVAEFDPSTGSMIEYPVPCCNTTLAGPYSIALGKNGTVWFSELYAKYIGELVPLESGPAYSLSLGQYLFSLNSGSSSSTDAVFYSDASSASDNVTFGISGVTPNGDLRGLTAIFNPDFAMLTGQSNVTGKLNVQANGISPGTYYLTVSAILGSNGVTYSRILKLTITDLGSPLLEAGIIGAVISVAVIFSLFITLRRRKQRLGSAKRRRYRKGQRHSVYSCFQRLTYHMETPATARIMAPTMM